MPDVADGDAVPFAQGRLTDRRAAIQAAKKAPRAYAEYELPDSHWMVAWAQPDPVAVIFDLRQAWFPIAVRIWFCESLPALTVAGSADGTQWHTLGRAVPEEAGADVRDLDIALTGQPASRYIRVNLGARQPGQRLGLVEVEVWGKDAAAAAR
jgi:hypothetical protein